MIVLPKMSRIRGNHGHLKLKEVKVEKLDDKSLLKYLLGNIEIAPIVAKYLKRTMELRNLLIDCPRRIL